MNARLAIAILAALLGACARPAPERPASVPAAARGKPTAPVEVDATLQPGAARITVAFGADASEVAVRLSGADGLRVTSAPAPVERGRFRRGEQAALEATFAPGEGQSLLVVSVQGTFEGRRLAAVRAFAVGTRSPAQEEKARAGLRTDERGELLHVLPAEPR